MNYIVFDLEWNQPDDGEEVLEKLPFEIIEIGAVKLAADGEVIDRFSELVRPVVYHSINNYTGNLVHVKLEELKEGRPFVKVMERFRKWCGKEEYIFCTWGPADLTELQRNIAYFGLEPVAAGPIEFFDVQKLYTLAYEENKRDRRSLEHAVDELHIVKDIPFHRALSDAYYTAKVLLCLLNDYPEKFSYVSYDLYHPPLTKKEEIRVQFDNYAKYVSRVFANKKKALMDREVVSTKCYLCHRNLPKQIKWFTINGRHYYCLAYCEKHGYLKGKIRIRKFQGESVYIVKTTKLITDAEADKIREKRLRV